MPFSFFKTEKQNFKKEKIKDILKKGYILPTQIQRDLETERVNELIVDFEKDFQPYAPIYFCIFEKQRYVIDGQHRLNIFEKNNKYNDDIIWISEIIVDNFDDMKEIFRIINNQLPMNELWQRPKAIKEILLETYQYFVDNYPNSFKFKGKRRPYLCKELFKTQISLIQEELCIFKTEELIERIKYVNDIYSNMHYDNLPQKGKTSNLKFKRKIEEEKCLYLGMVEEWTRHCINRNVPENMYSSNDFNANRFKVWEKYMGNVARGKCYCCDNIEIAFYNFEAGHVKAKSLGGSDDIDNLRPICSFCNKSMGTENLYDYKRKLSY